MSKPEKIIIILGGGLVKNPDNSFRTARFNETGDNSGLIGGGARVDAAAYLLQEDSERLIIASGGQGILPGIGQHPDISKVIKNELLALGVEEKKIIEENKSDTTYQQLIELKKLLTDKNVIEVVMITNQWHLPRVQAMIEGNADFKDFYQKINCQFLTAEEIVIKEAPEQWQKIIEAAYQSPAMQERLAAEERGIKQINEGTYKYA
ncbi:MAG: YdcF family protein [Candidatus Komeilibacteria bacterium]|nr:YdcF family protein [Candidatus Komeilibacteria bacterium]